MSKRTYEQITESERHAIALGLQQKQSLRAIARALGRSPSTISREILRNAGGKGYVSRFAQQRSKVQAQGFDARFQRTWEFYLAYCEAGFDARSIDVVQYTLIKD